MHEQFIAPQPSRPSFEAISLDEAARLLRISREALVDLRLRGGGPPAFSVGRRYLYPALELLDWAIDNGDTRQKSLARKLYEGMIAFADSFRMDGLAMTVTYHRRLPGPALANAIIEARQKYGGPELADHLRGLNRQHGELHITESEAKKSLSRLRRIFMRAVFGSKCLLGNRSPLSSFFVIEYGSKRWLHHHGKMECPGGIPKVEMARHLRLIAADIPWIDNIHLGQEVSTRWDAYCLKWTPTASCADKWDELNTRRRT